MLFPNPKNKPNRPADQPDRQNPNSGRAIWRRIGTTVIWVLLILTVVPWFWNNTFGDNQAETVDLSYSDFREQLQAGNIDRVIVAGDQLQGEFVEPIPPESAADEPTDEESTATVSQFVTYLPSFGDESLLPLLEAHNVEIETRPESDIPWFALLANVVPILLFIGLGVLIFRGIQSQGRNVMSIGQSRAKLYDQENQKEPTTFDDVAGADGAKTELAEIVGFLKEPERYARLGAETPKGVLLVGPPGTGKTLLARAVAGEAGAPFFSISGSDFMEMFVGVGASRVRQMFTEAKKAAPCIIFIDEIDSIGRRRGAGLGGGHDEREQTLNQLLSELDGFEPSENVIVIAATNRPDILDPALLRPGRFDRQITVDLPTMSSRVEILKIHAHGKPLASDIDLKEIARGAPGFSGADLKNMLNEAALLAGRKGKNVINNVDVEEARDKILMGLEREGLVLTDEECQLIAYHEAGHAVVAAVLPQADPVHKVTIVPRGRAMGVTQQLPEREKYIYPREYMLDRLAVMMGGRAAENLIFDTATSGAENDLIQATQLARRMVVNWGMSQRLGRVAWGGQREQIFLGEEIAHRRDYSEATAKEIDEEVKTILDEAYTCAVDTLETNRTGLDRLAGTLLNKEEVMGDEVLDLLDLQPKPAQLSAGPNHHNGHSR
ncbi:MAG: ATP-dependent metallopeptidase FtsH/Yme1/Tma family protein [Anaerolineales bacterium]|nr:ATP-dependent metallopeptidase FtsH/Yme1/Tma family protein [Anaerolineales bacterium]